MAALCLITLGNVVTRYLTNVSFAFTEEYSIALMVVVTMLGTSIATAADRQIRITWFASLPAPRRSTRRRNFLDLRHHRDVRARSRARRPPGMGTNIALK